jgi:hypothetical protein
VEIEMVVRKNFRQEDRVAEILKTRGTHPGLGDCGLYRQSSQNRLSRRPREPAR